MLHVHTFQAKCSRKQITKCILKTRNHSAADTPQYHFILTLWRYINLIIIIFIITAINIAHKTEMC